MENDPVNKSNEEEYQFNDTEHSAEFAPMSAKSSSPPPTREVTADARKKIFIAIGIVVAVFCLYKLYGVFSEAPTKPKTEMPAVTAKVPEVVVAPKPPVPTEAQEVSGMQDKMETLQKVVSQVSQSNANLQDQMAGVSTSMADIQNSLSTLSQQVSDLVKAKETPVEVKKPDEKKVVKAKSKTQTKTKTKTKRVVSGVRTAENTSYHVKAMIQGRAWLISSAGATFTVSVGDTLPGYGEVRSIDTEKGQIVTSSGAVIGHRADDR